MFGNSFGKLFKITTFGESHGEALGVVIDGFPANIKIDTGFIQQKLNERRPGQTFENNKNLAVTERTEADELNIISGVFKGYSTGTPICVMIKNTAQHSDDYENMPFRPGHADYTYCEKHGFYDYRGGGRASGRETVARVAAGAFAFLALRELYGEDFKILSYTAEAAGIKAKTIDYSAISKNPLKCPDLQAAKLMEEKIATVKKDGDSVGAIIKTEVFGIPSGLGEPVFDKLDAELAKAMLSIGAVKGIEFGKGFESANMLGSEWNDQMRIDEKGNVQFDSNNAGGILGGISNGNVIDFRIAVKPVPSIAKLQKTFNEKLENVELQISGRHDVCLAPRIIPVVEAMTALTLLDFALQQKANKI